MHELGHLLNGKKKDFYIEADDVSKIQDEEEIADNFAKSRLVNKRQYNELLKNIIISQNITNDIVEFSNSNDIAPDIVVGLLEHDLQKYDCKEFNSFIRKLEF